MRRVQMPRVSGRARRVYAVARSELAYGRLHFWNRSSKLSRTRQQIERMGRRDIRRKGACGFSQLSVRIRASRRQRRKTNSAASGHSKTRRSAFRSRQMTRGLFDEAARHKRLLLLAVLATCIPRRRRKFPNNARDESVSQGGTLQHTISISSH